jgi:hypothetical protein
MCHSNLFPIQTGSGNSSEYGYAQATNKSRSDRVQSQRKKTLLVGAVWVLAQAVRVLTESVKVLIETVKKLV